MPGRSCAGETQIVGHCSDDTGLLRPAWQIRAGDQISFIDASDTSYRRIVRVNYDDTTRTAQLSLDAARESLQGILERLGVSLIGLGLQ